MAGCVAVWQCPKEEARVLVCGCVCVCRPYPHLQVIAQLHANRAVMGCKLFNGCVRIGVMWNGSLAASARSACPVQCSMGVSARVCHSGLCEH